MQQIMEASLKNDVPALKRLLSRTKKAEPFVLGVALLYAAGNGSIKVVRYLLGSGVSPNYRMPDGETALFAAASHAPGIAKALTMMLDAGALVNLRDKAGRTALMAAAGANNVETLQVLIAWRADVRLKDKDGRTAEQHATTDAVRVMLHREAAGTTRAGRRLELVVAVRKNDLGAVRRILAAGGDVDARDDYGNTLLYIAAEKGRTNMAMLLLDKDATVDARSLDYERFTPLIVAAGNENVTVVKLLLQRGARPNPRSTSGWSALERSTIHGNFDIVRMLLDAKVDPNEVYDDHSTPLMNAAGYGHPATVELLISRGAKIDVQSRDGDTALMAAANNGYANVVKVLLKHHANVTTRNSRGETALDIALEKGHTEIVELLRQFNKKP